MQQVLADIDHSVTTTYTQACSLNVTPILITL
jgi:hypothetical protein